MKKRKSKNAIKLINVSYTFRISAEREEDFVVLNWVI